VAAISTARLDELLERFRQLTVTVVGDFCLDRYACAEVSGRSREHGDSVRRVWKHTFNPGGAGNVASNFAALGARTRALSVSGDDWFREILVGCLRLDGVDASGLLKDPDRQTMSFEKTRATEDDGTIVCTSIYVDTRLPVSGPVDGALLGRLRADRSDILVVADYAAQWPGTVTANVLAEIRRQAALAGRFVIAISRARLCDFAPAMLAANEYEICRATNVAEPELFEAVDERLVRDAGEKAARLTGKPCFTTIGARGILVSEPNGNHTPVPTAQPRGEVEIIGAGDSALAGIALGLAAGATNAEAALLGNMVANVTIHKLNTTGTASPDEMRDVLQYF